MSSASHDSESFFSALAQPGVRGLRAYDPGHDLVALRRKFSSDALIELGSNENPIGPSPRALQAAHASLAEVHRYPDPLGGDLSRALAARHGVKPAQILLGNGSHELLMQFAQVFAGPDADVVASRFGFAVYALAAQAAGATLRIAETFPCNHEVQPRGHDLGAIAAQITGNTRLVYLANPNNPTGTWFAGDTFAQFMRGVPENVIVVVDEAYAEFALADADDYRSALDLLPQHRNLVVTRSFSKAYALAGLRVGYAMADAGLIAVMQRVRESFNGNMPGLAAAEAALNDQAHLDAGIAANREQRDMLINALRERGWIVTPSATNFLLVEFGKHTPAIEKILLARGVVLRPMGGYGLPDCLRITVGTSGENTRLLSALDIIAE
ncbi:MAG: histidinol-phosphate transaminase [Lysobacteraceae bacterium]